MSELTGDLGAAALMQQARAFGELLSRFEGGSDDGADLVGLLGALEELKCRAEGAQVMASVALDATQRAEQAAAGVPAERRGLGVGLQVALARRVSHHRGRQHLGLARTLVSELPGTLAALRAGRISAWRATLVARESACLSREHRTVVDAQLSADAGLAAWGEGELVAQLRQLAYHLDPASVVARRAHAQGQRAVWLRPAPDTMTYLTALLPVTAGVGVYAALTRAADTAIAQGDTAIAQGDTASAQGDTTSAQGDQRSRAQVMADLLVTRVLGQPDGGAPQIPVTVNLVVSDQVLLGTGDPDPTGGAATGDGHAGGYAQVQGYGPVPASLARELAGAPAQARVQLRRLYARPTDGALVGMDSKARCFPQGLAQLIRLRDRTCRTPWCDAPIRHIDHAQPAGHGGPTSLTNAQGMCEACNHAKQAPGFTQHVMARHPHQVLTTTPTGHTYRSTAPPCPQPADLSPPGAPPPERGPTPLETTVELAIEHWTHAA